MTNPTGDTPSAGLLPCPFCINSSGLPPALESATASLTYTIFAVVCGHCGASATHCPEPDEAVAAWNTRQHTQPVTAADQDYHYAAGHADGYAQAKAELAQPVAVEQGLDEAALLTALRNAAYDCYRSEDKCGDEGLDYEVASNRFLEIIRPYLRPTTQAAGGDEVVAKIDKALEMVHWLCQPEGAEGARRWVMSIPARPDNDPDIVIASALYAAKAAIQQGSSHDN